MKTHGWIIYGLIVLLFSSCARFPHQKGSWVGVIERRAFYTGSGEELIGLCLVIEEGPRMGDPSFRGLQIPHVQRNQFFDPAPILVDKSRRAFNVYSLEGKRAKVSGEIGAGPALDPIRSREFNRTTKTFNKERPSVSPLVLKTDKDAIVLLPSSRR